MPRIQIGTVFLGTLLSCPDLPGQDAGGQKGAQEDVQARFERMERENAELRARVEALETGAQDPSALDDEFDWLACSCPEHELGDFTLERESLAHSPNTRTELPRNGGSCVCLNSC